MSGETARVVNQLLVYAATAGTGSPANFGSTEIAGKTGTSSFDYDRWFAGYTSYYSGVVWYGYDYPKTVVYGGQNPAAVTWKKVMSKVHNGLAYKSLNKPETLVECQYCFESGMLPSESCTMLEMGNFLPDGVPTAICDAHGTAAPPADTPAETPPADTPVETPPVETPPVETPPEEKPVETPDDEKQDDKQQQDEKEDDKKEPDNTDEQNEKPTE
jgi:penicillin-binding protein 1A